MTRRDLLRRLLAGSALTAAGLYVPTKTYSFLWDNPLAKQADIDTFARLLKSVYGPVWAEWANSPGPRFRLTGIDADLVVAHVR